MDRLVIRGGNRLEGSVEIHGAKNAVLPQIAAALLSSEPLSSATFLICPMSPVWSNVMQEFGVRRRPVFRAVFCA